MNLDRAAPDAAADIDAGMLATLRAGLRLMALHRLRDPDLADDVAQETMARALAALRSREGSEIRNLGAFVHGIARHVIADVLHQRQREAGPDALEHTPDPDSIRDALAHAVSNDERAQVHAALRRLSTDDRTILRLSFFEGLTPGELAARLDTSSVLIRKRKSRALERLRRIFLAEGSGHEAPRPTTDGRERGEPLADIPEISA